MDAQVKKGGAGSFPDSCPPTQDSRRGTQGRLQFVTRPPIAILGVPFDNITIAEAIQAIERMVASRQPHYVVTANVDFLVQAHADIELRRILCEAHLVLCDGTPLVWASRLLGNPLPERVAGADLVPLLIRVAAQKRYRLFFLGATPDSAGRAVANLTALYPDLEIAGHYSPPFNRLLEMDHGAIQRRILAAKPDILFVCLGCPKQEKWMAMHYRALGVPVTAGVGATMDFLAGHVKRAPAWMQRTGIEWLFRLKQEPRRLFRRYLKDLWVFGWCFLAQWWQLGRQAPGFRERPQNRIEVSQPEGQTQADEFPVAERLDLQAVRGLTASEQAILPANRHLLLQMAGVKFIDSTGVGLLIRWQKRVRATGHELVLVAPSPAVERALGLLRLESFFVTAPNAEVARELLEIRVLERSGVLVSPSAQSDRLVWRGEITAANVGKVWEQTQAGLLALGPGTPWTIDLSALRFIDSSGLGVMLRASKLARKRGTSLSFVTPQPAVLSVIRLAGLEPMLLGEKRDSTPCASAFPLR
jgi:N-acetylglucosaminyldiphosphoundecaprenol N-acetyl-beta-D-mannosaminyltransferase